MEPTNDLPERTRPLPDEPPKRRWFRSLIYYAASIPVLTTGVRSRRTAIRLMLGLARPPVCIELADGTRLILRTALELWVAKETCLDRQYERFGLAVDDRSVVLDIGASIGDFAISVARRRPGCVVHAVEPEPSSYALLRANLELNGVLNVHPHRLAVGGRDGTVRLDVQRSRPPLSSTSRWPSPQGSSVLVAVRRLDSLLEELALSRVDLLKIDCEGAETEILQSADAATLRRVAGLCVEYHDAVSGRRLEVLLRDAGYRVTHRASPVHRGTGLLYAASPRE